MNDYLDYLSHEGILGQKWGLRNGPPYPLNPATDYSAKERKLNRIDKKFVRKNDKKIRKYASTVNKDELNQYAKELANNIQKYNSNGKISKSYATQYSKKMAELYNKSIDGLEAPSGRVVKFVAMRGQIGVMTALADPNYDMKNVKNGVYTSGKVAYKKKTLNKMDI